MKNPKKNRQPTNYKVHQISIKKTTQIKLGPNLIRIISILESTPKWKLAGEPIPTWCDPMENLDYEGRDATRLTIERRLKVTTINLK